MRGEYIFYQGWNKVSRDMEKFLNENSVPYKLVHRDLDENSEALILLPGLGELYGEKYFEGLKKSIKQSLRDKRNN